MIVEQHVYDFPRASAAFVAAVLRDSGRERGARGPVVFVATDGWEISLSRKIAAAADAKLIRRLRVGAKGWRTDAEFRRHLAREAKSSASRQRSRRP